MPSQTSRFAAMTARASSTEARPLMVNAVLAAALAVATAVGLCMAVSLLGWFFADSGAHGSTLDALRVGGIAWILGLGGSADTSIGHVGLTPLGLTFIEVLAVVRCTRWGWRRSELGEQVPAARTWAVAWGTFTATFVILAIVVLEAMDASTVSPSLTGTFGAALLLGGAASAWGAILESGRLSELWLRTPPLARSILRIAARASLTVAAVAAVVVAISMAMSFSAAGDAYTSLKLGFGDALMLTLVCALALPNMVGLAIAYLAGPGFAVGATTSVTVSSVSLIALPPLPVVAALPDPGSQPGWLVLLLFVPGLCALVAAIRLQRELAEERDGWDQVVLRGLGGGALAGAVLTVFAGLSGGALGDQRLAHIGAGFWAVLVCAAGGMALGGALGGLLCAAWQRWREAR
ncbi:MAG: cell division protein PerM [Marmoricola sp.]